ncbi:MAG: small multi-drug export protein [Spirochaetaceae bacterium]|jgi:uncharacterized membrane protein|nr:small multi-drug export protein [Spirochaetaceae bacterium]
MIYLWTAFFSLLPISELRGAIPFALLNGIPWFIAWPFAVAVNSLAAPLCWVFLSTLHRLFYGPAETRGEGKTRKGFSWYRTIFDRFVERARLKLHRGVEKWGVLGIALFVAIPLPITGAWTGTLGAWVLGLSKRKTLPAVILGVTAAGAIVTAIMLLGKGAFRIFIRTL